MPTLLQAAGRDALRARVAALRPDTPARWGRFTAPQMIAHAIQSLAMMTGEVPVARARVPWIVRSAPVRYLLVYVLPFPKGLPTTPELLARRAVAPSVSEAEWAEELRAFDRALDSVAARAASATEWPPHPAFGPISGKDWGALQYRHIDHHFRQFGL